MKDKKKHVTAEWLLNIEVFFGFNQSQVIVSCLLKKKKLKYIYILLDYNIILVSHNFIVTSQNSI